MSIGLYVHGASPLHRLRPGIKVGVLVAAGLGVFLVRDAWWLLPVLGMIAGLYALARIPPAIVLVQLRPFVFLFVLFFLVHGALTTWTLGLLVVLRFAVLVLLGMLVTLTTRTSEMVEALERGLAPLAPMGVNARKVSLALSLALRFVPLLYDRAREVREAQRARGLERSFTALAVPLLVRTLRMAGDLTDAIEARGFDGDERADAAGPDEDEERRRRKGPSPRGLRGLFAVARRHRRR